MKSNSFWKKIKDKKRIVVKVGSSTLTHRDTGNLNYVKLEKLVRALSDMKNSGKEVILVSSGAVALGREALKIGTRPKTMAEKQACAAIGQCRLMTNYHKLFTEYGQIASQVLLTYGAVPIVNENDTIATNEIEFGENDTLSAIVSAVTKADLLILLTDTDGLYTDDPFQNAEAKLIDMVTTQRSDSDVGTGGMYTKVMAANIVNPLGIDMIISNGKNPNILNKIMNGEKHGTLFVANEEKEQDIRNYLVSQINQ